MKFKSLCQFNTNVLFTPQASCFTSYQSTCLCIFLSFEPILMNMIPQERLEGISSNVGTNFHLDSKMYALVRMALNRAHNSTKSHELLGFNQALYNAELDSTVTLNF